MARTRYEIRATDAVGNVGNPAERTVTVDTDPPETTITAGVRDGGVTPTAPRPSS